MPRLDAERISLWRQFCTTSAALQRQVDAQLIEQHDLPLAWYDVLTVVRDAGGSMRVHRLCAELDELPSSLSRRLDRMEAEGLLQRISTPTADDRRAVTVSVTTEGRHTWRDANITYRRMVQQLFAHRLTETDIAAMHRVLGKAGS